MTFQGLFQIQQPTGKIKIRSCFIESVAKYKIKLANIILCFHRRLFRSSAGTLNQLKNIYNKPYDYKMPKT